MEVIQLRQQHMVAGNEDLPLCRFHQDIDHLPTCAFVTGGQFITNGHDGQIFVDKISQIKVGFQGSGTVNGQTRDKDGHQKDAHLLFLLHPHDAFGKLRKFEHRWVLPLFDVLLEHHVKGAHKHGRRDERRNNAQREGVTQSCQWGQWGDDVGQERSHGRHHRQR